MFAGTYCTGYGLTEPTANCSGGYYCPGGQNTSTPVEYQCTPGHYCPIGSDAEVSCPSGEYQDEFTQVSFFYCLLLNIERVHNLLTTSTSFVGQRTHTLQF